MLNIDKRLPQIIRVPPYSTVGTTTTVPNLPVLLVADLDVEAITTVDGAIRHLVPVLKALTRRRSSALRRLLHWIVLQESPVHILPS